MLRNSYLYIHIYMCMNICTYTCTNNYKYIQISLYTNMHLYIHIRICTFM